MKKVTRNDLSPPTSEFWLMGSLLSAFQTLKNCNPRMRVPFNQQWSVVLKRAHWMRPTVETNNSEKKEQL
jgi:hypothetical protein